MFEGMGKRPTGDPKTRAATIFKKIDINGDGDLSENEFIKGCSDDKVDIYKCILLLYTAQQNTIFSK